MSVLKSVLLFGLVVATLAAASDPDFHDPSNFLNGETNQDDPVVQMMAKECRAGYSSFCLKLNLVRLVNRGSGITVPLLPGLSITSSPSISEVSNSMNQSEIIRDPNNLDTLLIDRLSDFLGSLSLNVKIMDKGTPLSFAKTYLGDNVASARKKNRFGGALMAAGMMSGGTLLAAAMAAMAAMAGKALMASLLALMLSALSALKGQGGGGEKTTYEVISKPVVSHLHTHSSEVQHAGHHGHYRSIDAHDSNTAAHDVAYSAHDVAYAAHSPQVVEQDQVAYVSQINQPNDYLPVVEERHR